jgi:hypothetical protein
MKSTFPGLVLQAAVVLCVCAGTVPDRDPEPLRVYLDCRATGCDVAHFRNAITFVDWVVDSGYADVHVLVTSQALGGGGREHTFRFLGRARREGLEFHLTDASDRSATRDEIRSVLTQSLTLGLAALSIGTGVEKELQVVRRAGQSPVTMTGAVRPRGQDPWNAWIFRVGLSGSSDAEQSVGSFSLTANADASRVTDAWKMQYRVGGSRFGSRFELSDSVTIRSHRESFNGSMLVVRSLGNHVSTGFRASGGSASYMNQDLRLQLAPAVEFSAFPYSEASSRQLTFRYAPGVARYHYAEETIFGLVEEDLMDHHAALLLDLVQPWGGAQFRIEGSMLMRDMSQNHVDVSGDLSWRVSRGLSLSVFTMVSKVANQRSLRRGLATDEEILLRQRELATSYRYSMSLGLSYSFGSRFAGAVNPRMQ